MGSNGLGSLSIMQQPTVSRTNGSGAGPADPQAAPVPESDGLPVAAIGGAAGGVAVLLAGAALMYVLLGNNKRFRNKKRVEPSEDKDMGEKSVEAAGSAGGPASDFNNQGQEEPLKPSVCQEEHSKPLVSEKVERPVENREDIVVVEPLEVEGAAMPSQTPNSQATLLSSGSPMATENYASDPVAQQREDIVLRPNDKKAEEDRIAAEKAREERLACDPGQGDGEDAADPETLLVEKLLAMNSPQLTDARKYTGATLSQDLGKIEGKIARSEHLYIYFSSNSNITEVLSNGLPVHPSDGIVLLDYSHQSIAQLFNRMEHFDSDFYNMVHYLVTVQPHHTTYSLFSAHGTLQQPPPAHTGKAKTPKGSATAVSSKATFSKAQLVTLTLCLTL
mmetsp:Transcript_21766/g.54963  ORF Transcript_21766/g.54963 Transcript_21766/m.54963 type:complete len:391 (-) Transcript_21766:1791-2963(-)